MAVLFIRMNGKDEQLHHEFMQWANEEKEKGKFKSAAELAIHLLRNAVTTRKENKNEVCSDVDDYDISLSLLG